MFSRLSKLPETSRQMTGWIAGALVMLVLRYLSELPFFDAWARWRPFAQKFTLTAFLIFLVLILGRVVQAWISTHEGSEGNRYNLLRITRLVTLVFVAILVLSFLFQNLYAAAASFGLISLVLGFALQSPITSFIAWLYIVFRSPYHVGDRIQFKGMRGDVVEIHYLNTTIEECSGDYLGNDRQSGRLIHFPNSVVLTSEIINYSGQFAPFIWNETALQVAYTSDLSFVEACLVQATNDDFTERYPELADLTTDRYAPAVYFRSNPRAWMEAVVSYPVEPFDTTGRRNRILRRAMPLLNASPASVQFPAGTNR